MSENKTDARYLADLLARCRAELEKLKAEKDAAMAAEREACAALCDVVTQGHVGDIIRGVGNEIRARGDTGALEAVRREAKAEARKVKPLVWEDDWTANTPWGCYVIQCREGPSGEWGHFGWGHSSRGDTDESDEEWPTIADARAAAQADYERRILSTLIPDTDKEGE